MRHCWTITDSSLACTRYEPAHRSVPCSPLRVTALSGRCPWHCENPDHPAQRHRQNERRGSGNLTQKGRGCRAPAGTWAGDHRTLGGRWFFDTVRTHNDARRSCNPLDAHARQSLPDRHVLPSKQRLRGAGDARPVSVGATRLMLRDRESQRHASRITDGPSTTPPGACAHSRGRQPNCSICVASATSSSKIAFHAD